MQNQIQSAVMRPGRSLPVHWPGTTLRIVHTRQGKRMFRNVLLRPLALGAIVATSIGIGYAIGAQPHMESALGLLRNARAELGAATPNKGGHREKAMGLIDQAMDQVREGIAFAATH